MPKSIIELLKSYGTLVEDDALSGGYRYTLNGGWDGSSNGTIQLTIHDNNINDIYNRLNQRMLDMVNRIEHE